MDPLSDPYSDVHRATTLAEYVGVVRRRWRWLVAAIVAVLVIGGAMVLQATPMYRSSATIVITPIVGTGGMGAATSVGDQVELIRGGRVRGLVIERIGGPIDASFAQGSSEAASLRITAESADPDRAALVATTYSDVFAELLMELDLERIDKTTTVLGGQLDEAEAALAQARADNNLEKVPEIDSRLRFYVDQLRALADQRGFVQQGRITVVTVAEVPTEPFAPRPERTLALALALGVLAGLGLVFLREHLDDRLDGHETIERSARGLPVIGSIPVADTPDAALGAVLTKPGATTPVVEAYRSARNALDFLNVDTDRRIIQVTSALQGDGKSTSVAHLAIGFARADRRVLVVDLDLRRPRQHVMFGVDNTMGFTSLLLGHAGIDDVVQTVPGIDGLHVLTSGPIPPDPSELLASRRATTTVHDLAALYDVVLVDSPPVLAVSDPSVIARIVDGTVIVVRAGTVRPGELTSTLDQLGKVGARTMGIIIVGVDTRRHRYGYGYGYGYAGDYGTVTEPTATTPLTAQH